MTVASTTNRNDYVGNGAVDTYSYSFRIFADSDLLVTIADTTGVETELTLTTHYTVTGAGASSGGNVALVNGSFDWIDADGDLKTGYSLTIRRVRPLTQLTDIRNQGSYFPEDIEDAFDHLMFVLQQHQDELNRCLKAAETEDQEFTLPPALASALIGWNAAGDELTNYTPNSSTYLTKASQAEAEAGTDNAAYMTALRTFQSTKALLLALTTGVNFAKAADKASATTCDIGAVLGNFVHITGTVTITGLGTVQGGTTRFVRFAGALTLTHNATSLILPGGTSITTAANDTAVFVSEGSGNWRCIFYSKASGLSVVAPNFQTAATQTEMEAAASNTAPVTPLNMKWHPGPSKAWAHFTCGGGTPSITASYNVTSISDRGSGLFTANWTTAFSSADYAWGGSAYDSSTSTACGVGMTSTESDQTASALQFVVMYWTGGTVNNTPERVSVYAWGDQ